MGHCNILTLRTDNSAVRMLSLKFGVGRLRHIRGRMLWLQERMANQELNIRQVPTCTMQDLGRLCSIVHGIHVCVAEDLAFLLVALTCNGLRYAFQVRRHPE